MISRCGRKERIADATFFYKNAVFYALAQRYFEKPEDGGSA